MFKKWFPIHVHSSWSFLDGYGMPKQYIAHLIELDLDGIALTDHGNIYGHVPFAEVFKASNKHFVYGCEMYAIENLTDHVRYHITVLAKNNVGYQNLLKLVNQSYKQFYYKPRIMFQQIADHAEGLIILSGCVSDGWLNKNPSKEHLERWLQWFKKCEWYLELQPFIDEQEKWDRLTHYGKQYGVPIVITVDSHYLKVEDKATHDFMLAINTNKPLSDPDRLKMDYPLHLPTGEEMLTRCQQMGFYQEEWLTETVKIANACSVELPKTELLKIYATPDMLKERCLKRLEDFSLKTSAEYQQRLSYELDIIEQKQFMDYFWIIQDVVNWAKNNNIFVGPARGSVAGSLVAWALGITEVDPIKHGLLFERFVSPERADLPDIDLDFSAPKREQVIAYIRERYGWDRTAQLITFATFKPKGIIQSAARVMQIPQWEVKEATAQIIERSGGDSRAELCLSDSISTYEQLRNLFKKYPKLQDAIALEGTVYQLSKHAAAVVISQKPLEQVGIINQEGNFGMDKHYLENYGLLKIDILGLETLNIIQDICQQVGVDWRMFYTLPLDDELTFERVFKAGKLAGVFQFEGLSMSKVCEDIMPSCFDHLVHITALGRPGPLNCGSTRDYIRRIRGEPWSVDPALHPYVTETLGTVIYQEQVMNVVRNIGQFEWNAVGLIRKAMSKSLGEEFFHKYWPQFKQGALSQNIDEDRANNIWKKIVSHGSMSFNKSHAVCYALLSYWIGYCKAHWPAQFYTRILKNKVSDEEIKPILKEWDGSVVPLDLNLSKVYFTTDGKQLIGGWTNIKGIGEKAAHRIVVGQPYKNWQDFATRNPKGIVSKVELVVQNGQSWSDLTPLWKKVESTLQGIKFSVPLCYTFKEILNSSNMFAAVVGRVIHRNCKDANEQVNVVKRGYRVVGLTEYLVLKVQTDSDFHHITFDRYFFQQHKQELLATEGKICLFKVRKLDNRILIGEKFKILT